MMTSVIFGCVLLGPEADDVRREGAQRTKRPVARIGMRFEVSRGRVVRKESIAAR